MKKLLTICLLTFCLSLSASPLFAQFYNPQHADSVNLKVPPEWEVRLDNPNEKITIGSDAENTDIFFVNMEPGWHITTGPRAIFYNPNAIAGGTYRVSAKIHLFDPRGRNEAFGLFIGGKNLEKADQTYTYFLLRNSGEYLIKKRIGDETKVVKDWSKAPSMVVYKDTSKSSVPNTLSVEVGENQVSFFINGEKVETLSRNRIDTEGIVGLRVNHMLNLHIENLSVEEL